MTRLEKKTSVKLRNKNCIILGMLRLGWQVLEAKPPVVEIQEALQELPPRLWTGLVAKSQMKSIMKEGRDKLLTDVKEKFVLLISTGLVTHKDAKGPLVLLNLIVQNLELLPKW